MQWWFALLVQLLFSYLATVAFAIIINVPRKALNLAGWAGMMGWLAYWLLMEVGSGRMMANLVGAFVIGLCGIFFARYKKMPVIIFNIPGFVPLVPGAVAYQAVRATVLGRPGRGLAVCQSGGHDRWCHCCRLYVGPAVIRSVV